MLALCALTATAQRRTPAASARVDDAARGAWIHGSVVSDLTGQPLLRAQVILKPVSGATSSVLAETDERGRFILNRISPGTYSIVAQRDGYLPSANARRGPLRLPGVLLLREGVRVRDLTFRLRPWGVISGRIRFDDAEPAVGASVQLYRETVNRGRHSMQLVTTARVNDRGEFRVHGLSPGGYIVAATRNRSATPDVEEQEPVDEQGRGLTEYRYATTFFPAAQKLADAVEVRVDAGQEVGGIDVYLNPVPAVRIRGRVLNGITGQVVMQPNIVFRRMSADGQSSISVPVNQQPWRDGFEVKGVTSGPYLVTCDSEHEGKRIAAREYLTVTDAPIDNLDLTLEPERDLTAVIRFDDSGRVPASRLRVNLEPRSDLNPGSSADADGNGNSKLKVRPGESYDAYVGNLPDSFYVKSLRIGNLDVGPEGIPGSAGGSNVPLEILLSGRSATLTGRAFTAEGNAAGGAAVVLVPDPARGRAPAYRAGNADEYGLFRLIGVAPGRYTLFAFFEEPPCDFYDEDTLTACRAQGRAISATEAGQVSVEVRIP